MGPNPTPRCDPMAVALDGDDCWPSAARSRQPATFAGLPLRLATQPGATRPCDATRAASRCGSARQRRRPSCCYAPARCGLSFAAEARRRRRSPTCSHQHDSSPRGLGRLRSGGLRATPQPHGCHRARDPASRGLARRPRSGAASGPRPSLRTAPRGPPTHAAGPMWHGSYGWAPRSPQARRRRRPGTSQATAVLSACGRANFPRRGNRPRGLDG